MNNSPNLLPMVSPLPTDNRTTQYLTFMLGNEVYAVGIMSIREIIEYGHVSEVPMMPSYMSGVINLRGRVVPVINLQARFGKPPSEIQKRSCIVIIEMVGQDSGVVVDSVCEVVEISALDIKPTPSLGSRIQSEFIEGMAKVNGHFVILLNIHAILMTQD